MSQIKPTTALARRATTSRRIANPGVKKLRKDADNKIRDNSTEIAEALYKQTTLGNASSARLLVDLADGADWTEHTDAVAEVLSLALNEWQKAKDEKKEPETAVLHVITNPAKQPKPAEPRQLTDGSSEIIDAEFSDAEPAP